MKFVSGPYILQFEEGASYPAPRSIEKIQVSDRTASGGFKTENLGPSLRTRTLNFTDMIKTDHDNLKDWFDNIANASQFPFDFTDERGDTGEVIILDKKFNFAEADYELFNGTLILEYQ